ncbi:MAG: hypothetical protein GY749_22425 [Desulfobacteraceae bacterium]|nr:hypothetical protein [Desulfobacteraceae bacterium]
MEYKQCICKFWVEEKTKQCPDCGTSIDDYSSVWAALIGVVIAFLLFFMEKIGLIVLLWLLPVGFILGLLIGAMVVYLIRLRANHPYLIKDEQKIDQRQNDFRIKEQKISEAMEQLEESFKLVEKPTEQLELAKKTLQNALDAVVQQKNEYKIKIWEIKLLRWHNPLKPLTIKINSDINSGQEQYDSYLNELEKIRNKGKVLLAEIQQLDVFDKGKSENYISQLSNGLEAINELITEIVERQAALDVQDAIKGVSFIQDTFPAGNPMIESTIAQVSSLDALLPDLDTLSSDLDKLEEAYFRLEAEKEIKRDFS